MTRTLSFAAGIILAGSIAAIAIPETLNRTIEGTARPIDGDTIDVRGVRVRLAEIDAPERDQQCDSNTGWFLGTAERVKGKWRWSCGAIATMAMRAMLARDPNVTCVGSVNDRYGRVVAHCRNSEGDLGGHMVALGLAIIWPRYSTGRYDDQQAAAKAERAGMWSGSFVEPWEWRHQNRR